MARSPASALPSRPSVLHGCTSNRRCRDCGRTGSRRPRGRRTPRGVRTVVGRRGHSGCRRPGSRRCCSPSHDATGPLGLHEHQYRPSAGVRYDGGRSCRRADVLTTSANGLVDAVHLFTADAAHTKLRQTSLLCGRGAGSTHRGDFPRWAELLAGASAKGVHPQGCRQLCGSHAPATGGQTPGCFEARGRPDVLASPRPPNTRARDPGERR